ncbi:MAG: VanZ family protein [Armatimonadetes bacterium]|nr:VanZ family protein [Armatimonadota bacterium]
MGLIFLTSSFVITGGQLADVVGNALPGPDSRESFHQFWTWTWVLFVKGYHFFEFAVLFWLVRWGLAKSLPWSRPTVIAAAFAFAALFAISDEWHQTFVPTRGGNWIDVLIDVAGITFAAWVTLASHRRKAAAARP